MEGLRKRAILLAGVFVVVGIGFQALSARAERITRTESWMIKVAPKELPGYTMVPSRDPKNPEVTYTSDPIVYQTLVPYGIVAREFREKGGPKHFDVNVIASSTKDSFHDPRVCFTAQGWNLDKQSEAIVKTSTRGDVPVTLAEMNHVPMFIAQHLNLNMPRLQHQLLDIHLSIAKRAFRLASGIAQRRF